jgi:hypothetical protein
MAFETPDHTKESSITVDGRLLLQPCKLPESQIR